MKPMKLRCILGISKVSRRFDLTPGMHFNTPRFLQLKLKIRPILPISTKNHLFWTIITNLTENGAFHVPLKFTKTPFIKVEIQ